MFFILNILNVYLTYYNLCNVMLARYDYKWTCENANFNLTMTIYNKCLQQSGYKITYLYEAIVDDLICAFMHIAH